MKSTTMCSQCLRTLRAGIRTGTASTAGCRGSSKNSLQHSYSSSRSLSTQTSRWQQAAEREPIPVPPREPPPPPMPASESTKASNASSLPSDPQRSLPDGPSTAEMQRHIARNLTGSKPSLSTSMAKSLRRAMPDTASTYMTYGLTESLFKSCSSHTSYNIPQSQRTQILSGTGPTKTAEGEDIGVPDPPLSESASPTRTFFLGDGPESLALLPTFSTWSQTTFLHMYLLTVRLRSLPPSASASTPGSYHTFQQYLLEHFSQSAENHMLLLHTISARSIRNRYLKDLFIQWRGIITAYDEGLVKGDAVLGSAVWRNVFKGAEDVDWQKVAMVVAYMRKAVVELNTVQDVDQLPRLLDGMDGVWARSLDGVTELVGKESSGMREAVP